MLPPKPFTSQTEFIEDAADIDARREKDREAETQRRLKRRTQSVQRGLPRPSTVNGEMAHRMCDVNSNNSSAAALLAKEMTDLVYFDHKGVTPKEEFSDESLRRARALLDAEMERMRERMRKEESDGDDEGMYTDPSVFIVL